MNTANPTQTSEFGQSYEPELQKLKKIILDLEQKNVSIRQAPSLKGLPEHLYLHSHQ